jgi:hypothetical protein
MLTHNTLSERFGYQKKLNCFMPADFATAFALLKPVLANYAKRLSVKTDTPIEYTLLTKSPSPYPQHKGSPCTSAPCAWEKPMRVSA